MKKIIRIVAIFLIVYGAITCDRCDVVSYHTFRALDYIGADVQVCCGDITYTDDWDHAWIRVNGIDIEMLTLNLIKPDFCDYDNPYFVSSDIDEIRIELFGT